MQAMTPQAHQELQKWVRDSSYKFNKDEQRVVFRTINRSLAPASAAGLIGYALSTRHLGISKRVAFVPATAVFLAAFRARRSQLEPEMSAMLLQSDSPLGEKAREIMGMQGGAPASGFEGAKAPLSFDTGPEPGPPAAGPSEAQRAPPPPVASAGSWGAVREREAGTTPTAANPPEPWWGQEEKPSSSRALGPNAVTGAPAPSMDSWGWNEAQETRPAPGFAPGSGGASAGAWDRIREQQARKA